MSEEPKKWKCGDIGPDGMVFWAYAKDCKNGEYWITSEKYDEKISAIKNRRINDPNAANKRQRRWYERNRDKRNAQKRKYNQKNRDKQTEQKRRRDLKLSFSRSSPSSYEEWLYSTKQIQRTAGSIAKLTPDPGQTLAELIHELSGYPMEVCEQIANPPEPEPDPQPVEEPRQTAPNLAKHPNDLF